MIKNVLFDLDGTIIDSSACIYWVYTELFKQLKLELPPKSEMRKFIGPPIETSIAKYVKEDVAAACERFRKIYHTVDLMTTNSLYEGIVEEIAKISDSGKKVFLATSKGEQTALNILKGFKIDNLFDGVYGSRYEIRRVNKSDIIESLIAERGLNKDECILVGDTLFDVEGAEKCGIKVGIVNYGFGSPEEFEGRDIAFFADSPTDIAGKIEEYCGQNN